MTAGLREQIAMHMHANVSTLIHHPTLDAFDSLANIMNMVGLTIVNEPKFAHEARLINGGALALQDIGRLLEASLPLQAHHLGPVRVAATAIDSILGWLDVAKLYTAEKMAVAAVRAMREAPGTHKGLS